MPYRLEWSNKSISILFNGTISAQEVGGVGRAVYGDERIDTIEYVIADLGNGDWSQIPDDVVKIAAATDSVTVQYKPILKMAFITQDDAVRAVCKQYIEYSSDFISSWSFGIFADYEDAREWCVR